MKLCPKLLSNIARTLNFKSYPTCWLQSASFHTHLLPQPPDQVFVGMSGGVDSSVAAYLLKKQGYRVVGVYMQNWDTNEEKGFCEGEADWRDVTKVCHHLGIELIKLNMVKEYWNRVFSVMVDEYASGFTPNADILCNQEIKFAALMDKLYKAAVPSVQASSNTLDFNSADSIGSDSNNKLWFATGHYAKVDRVDGQPLKLRRGKDPKKDQSYFLCCIPRQSLSRVIFPIGNLIKLTDVRRLAAEINLPTANKKESMGVCFIGERGGQFSSFLGQYITRTPGEIVCGDSGRVLGTHNGLYTRTLGQSAGLSISDKPWFLYAKDPDLNRMLAVEGHDHPLLYTRKFFAADVHWITEPQGLSESQEGFTARIMYQIRHLDKPRGCTITKQNGEWMFLLDDKRRGVTPGQFVALYQDDICLGGAKVSRIIPGELIK